MFFFGAKLPNAMGVSQQKPIGNDTSRSGQRKNLEKNRVGALIPWRESAKGRG